MYVKKLNFKLMKCHYYSRLSSDWVQDSIDHAFHP